MTSKKRNLAIGKVQITSVVDEELRDWLDQVAVVAGVSRGSLINHLLIAARLGSSDWTPRAIVSARRMVENQDRPEVARDYSDRLREDS